MTDTEFLTAVVRELVGRALDRADAADRELHAAMGELRQLRAIQASLTGGQHELDAADREFECAGCGSCFPTAGAAGACCAAGFNAAVREAGLAIADSVDAALVAGADEPSVSLADSAPIALAGETTEPASTAAAAGGSVPARARKNNGGTSTARPRVAAALTNELSSAIELAAAAGVHKHSAHRYLTELVDEGKAERVGRRWRLPQDSPPPEAEPTLDEVAEAVLLTPLPKPPLPTSVSVEDVRQQLVQDRVVRYLTKTAHTAKSAREVAAVLVQNLAEVQKALRDAEQVGQVCRIASPDSPDEMVWAPAGAAISDRQAYA